MSILTEKTIREIAVERPQSIRVFEKFGIDYCCGGAKPLEEACLKHGVQASEVLAAIRELELKAESCDVHDWAASSMETLVQYIVNTHHEFVRLEILRLEKMLEKVEAAHGKNHPEIGVVSGLFRELATEMTSHMMKEEEMLFPYIVRMEKAINEGRPAPPAFFGSVKNPTANMMTEHEAAGELLQAIRKNCDNFQVPEDVCPTFRATYLGLEEFERDLHQHVHLENNILFPRAIKAEKDNQPNN